MGERSLSCTTDKDISDKDYKEQDEIMLNNTKFFDSSSYRCCFSIFHAKIGTFIVVTLVFHEIIIGILYLLSRDALNFRQRNLFYIGIFVSRILQLLSTGVMYIGLWLQRRALLIPFAVSQLTFGVFADITTWLSILKHREERQQWLPFANNWRWLNIILPLIIYFICIVRNSCFPFSLPHAKRVVTKLYGVGRSTLDLPITTVKKKSVCLTFVLHQCSVYFRDRAAYERKRKEAD